MLDQINHTRQQSAGTAVEVEDEVDESNLCESEINSSHNFANN